MVLDERRLISSLLFFSMSGQRTMRRVCNCYTHSCFWEQPPNIPHLTDESALQHLTPFSDMEEVKFTPTSSGLSCSNVNKLVLNPSKGQNQIWFHTVMNSIDSPEINCLRVCRLFMTITNAALILYMQIGLELSASAIRMLFITRIITLYVWFEMQGLYCWHVKVILLLP